MGRPLLATTVRLAPLLAGALYAVLFSVKLADFTRALYLNADVSSGPVIARLLPTAPDDRVVVLGNYPWVEALWMQRALEALTGSRLLLLAGPFVLWALAVALVAFAVQRLTHDRGLTALGVVVIFAAGPAAWATYASWTVHGLVLVHLALVGAFWAWLVARDRGRGGLLAAVVVGLLTGVGAASDLLIVPAALFPLVGAAVLLPAAGRRTRGAIAVCLGAALGSGVLTRVVMGWLDLRAAGALSIGLASPADLDGNLDLAFRALAQVFNADATRLPLGGLKVAHIAAGAMALVWVAACGLAVRAALSGRLPEQQCAHVLFWSLSAVSLVLAVLFTTAAVDATASRYLIGVLFAAGALLPICAATGGRLRWVVTVSVAVYALVGVATIVRGELTVDSLRAPDAQQARALARYAERQGVRVAYAGYWDAMPLTWNAGGLVVYPVKLCDAAGRLCPFDFHRITSWYRPRGAGRSLLVLDRRIRALSVTFADRRLGAPAQRTQIGQMEVLVFERDIAGAFGPPTEGPR